MNLHETTQESLNQLIWIGRETRQMLHQDLMHDSQYCSMLGTLTDYYINEGTITTVYKSECKSADTIVSSSHIKETIKVITGTKTSFYSLCVSTMTSRQKSCKRGK